MSRRTLAAALVAAVAVLAMPLPARAHAALVSSSPAAGDTLATAPTQLVLRFSEPIDAASSRVELIAPGRHAFVLALTRDPTSVAGLVASLPPLAPGGYRVEWRTLSADGHPVDGSFVFFVADAAGSVTPAAAAPPAPEERVAVPRTPWLAAALRGMGVGALAASAGVLLMLLLSGSPAERGMERLATGLSVAAVVLLAAHALAWAAYARDPFGNETLLHPLTATNPGKGELLRLGFALMVVWALALARRPEFAIVLAACAVVATGVTGHAAAIHPAWSIPAKTLHVGALAVWAGGLAVLAATTRAGDEFRATALRASSLALAAVAVLLASGVVQTLLVSPGLGRLLRSTYGAVLIAKLIGMAVLVAIGARNRYRLVPRLPADDARVALRRSVRVELAVMLLVLLAAGLLAYVPVPRAPYAPAAVSLSTTDR